MYNLQLIEERIMSIALKMGLSKNKLLFNANLNKSVFDNMKKGQIPSVDKIHVIADYLGCSVDYLLGRTDNPERRCFPMPDNLSVDFDKILSEVQSDIDRGNQAACAKNPNANVNDIDRTAKIAMAVCLSALRAYHNELSNALKPHGTTDE